MWGPRAAVALRHRRVARGAERAHVAARERVSTEHARVDGERRVDAVGAHDRIHDARRGDESRRERRSRTRRPPSRRRRRRRRRPSRRPRRRLRKKTSPGSTSSGPSGTLGRRAPFARDPVSVGVVRRQYRQRRRREERAEKARIRKPRPVQPRRESSSSEEEPEAPLVNDPPDAKKLYNLSFGDVVEGTSRRESFVKSIEDELRDGAPFCWWRTHQKMRTTRRRVGRCCGRCTWRCTRSCATRSRRCLSKERTGPSG